MHKASKPVRPIASIVIAAVVIVGIFLGLLAYSYTQIQVNLNDVSLHSIDWEPLSWSVLLKLGLNVLTGDWLGAAFDLIRGINLDLVFRLSNNGLLPVYIPNLSYDLSINGVNMGKGHSSIDLTIYPGNTEQITVLQNFQKSSLTPAVETIVRNGGIIELRVSGIAYFELLGLIVPVPFQSTKQVSIADEIKNRLDEEIQKNQQQTGSSLRDSVAKSIGTGFEFIKNKIDELMDSLVTKPQQTPESEKIQTHIYLENVQDVQEGQTVTFRGSLFYKAYNGELYGVPNAQVGVLADWRMPYQPPNSDPFVGFTYTDQYGKFKISWTAKENPLTKSNFGSMWTPRAYFLGNDKFEKSEGGMGLLSFQVKKPDTVGKHSSYFVKSGDYVTLSGREIPDSSTVYWEQTGGERVEFFPSASVPEPTFRAPQVEAGSVKKLTFQVTITDILGRSIVDTIEITVLPRN